MMIQYDPSANYKCLLVEKPLEGLILKMKSSSEFLQRLIILEKSMAASTILSSNDSMSAVSFY